MRGAPTLRAQLYARHVGLELALSKQALPHGPELGDEVAILVVGHRADQETRELRLIDVPATQPTQPNAHTHTAAATSKPDQVNANHTKQPLPEHHQTRRLHVRWVVVFESIRGICTSHILHAQVAARMVLGPLGHVVHAVVHHQPQVVGLVVSTDFLHGILRRNSHTRQRKHEHSIVWHVTEHRPSAAGSHRDAFPSSQLGPTLTCLAAHATHTCRPGQPWERNAKAPRVHAVSYGISRTGRRVHTACTMTQHTWSRTSPSCPLESPSKPTMVTPGTATQRRTGKRQASQRATRNRSGVRAGSTGRHVSHGCTHLALKAPGELVNEAAAGGVR